jgi:hypothetical protein
MPGMEGDNPEGGQHWDVGPSGLLLAWDVARPAQERLGAAIYRFGYEPAGSRYSDLLRIALRFCAYVTVVMQEFAWNDTAHDALKQLKKWHVEDREAQEWPGTRTYKSARLMIFKFDADTAEALSRLTRRLYQWEQPALPEDLCLFDQLESPGSYQSRMSAMAGSISRQMKRRP